MQAKVGRWQLLLSSMSPQFRKTLPAEPPATPNHTTGPETLLRLPQPKHNHSHKQSNSNSTTTTANIDTTRHTNTMVAPDNTPLCPTIDQPRCPSPEIDTRKVQPNKMNDSVSLLDMTSASTQLTDTSMGSMDSTLDSTATVVKKNVAFADLVYIRTTLHINDYSDDEYETTWYKRADYQQFKRSFSKTVRVGNAVDEAGEEHCMRGLEFRTPKGLRRRRDNKFVGKCAVLDQQDRMLATEGKRNDEALGKGYRTVTRHCQNEARAVALKDQLEALHVYMAAHKGAKITAENERRQDRLRQFMHRTIKLRQAVIEEGKRMRAESIKARDELVSA